SRDRRATPQTLLGHSAARWTVEVLFGEAQELRGRDPYQVLSAPALLRFWTLVLAADTVLDEERERLAQATQRHVTRGEARMSVQRGHWRHLLTGLPVQCQAGASPEDLYERLVA